jgi:hypothetical protein
VWDKFPRFPNGPNIALQISTVAAERFKES